MNRPSLVDKDSAKTDRKILLSIGAKLFTFALLSTDVNQYPYDVLAQLERQLPSIRLELIAFA